MSKYLGREKEYKHEWYLKNKEKILKKNKIRYNNKKEEILQKQIIYNKHYRKELKPWFVSFDKANQRCNNPKQKGYKNYGGKGIQQLMTLDDFEFLWFRDKAYKMDRPSIHRKNSNKHYTISNCEFIELSKNSALTSRVKK